MRKKLCILLALAMLLSLTLAGCSSDKDNYEEATRLFENGSYAEAKAIFTELGDYENSAEMAAECDYAPLYGTWEYDMDLSEMMQEMISSSLGEELSGVDTEFIIPLNLTFREDKTWTLAMDMDSMTAAMERFMDSIVDVVVEMLYTEGEAQGLDRATLDAAFLQEYGMSVEEYGRTILGELDFSEAFADYEDLTGVYQLENGKLFMENSAEEFDENDYAIYSVDGDQLSLDADENSEDNDVIEEMREFGIELPLVFERQK